ncbi:unnamed protein product [Nesidiocoris tenuis]|uniref:Uncharacterized protein n=1 Tax=Nesidiocoris tenuis TaxID=355587 RepID=A0A6H5GZ48_9HEMI|nr:unnamed protein product [Nesidiocoris tenuis]
MSTWLACRGWFMHETMPDMVNVPGQEFLKQLWAPCSPLWPSESYFTDRHIFNSVFPILQRGRHHKFVRCLPTGSLSSALIRARNYLCDTLCCFLYY